MRRQHSLTASLILLFTLVLAPASLLAAAADQPDKRPPNIIFIMADDLGYGDIGVYGQEKIKTPNLDRMAAQGMRFTQFYAGSTVCAPSRSVLMTGKHTGHTRVRGNSRNKHRTALMPKDVTIAEVLKQVGYTTAVVGKWGLGRPGTTGMPCKQGFDFAYGFLDQLDAHFHYSDYLWRNGEKVILEQNKGDKRGAYANDLFTREALQFIERNQNQPFFLYLTYTIPHASIVVPEQSMRQYLGEFPEQPFKGGHYADQPTPNAARAGMITRLDHYIGRIFDKLKKLGIDRNTIVFFTSDNGPTNAGGGNPGFFNSNGPLRGRKRDLYEGGIRVPMIVRWPGHVPAGVVSDEVWAAWDVMPTLADLAGAMRYVPEDVDGISIAPHLLGKSKQLPKRFFYWEFHRGGFHQAARWGKWKAIRHGGKGEPIALYNLIQDIGEQHNVADEHPEVAKKMAKYMNRAHTPSKEWPAHGKPVVVE